MPEHTYGHTPFRKAFEQMDVYGVAYDEARASRARVRLGIIGMGGVGQSKYLPAVARLRMLWEPVEVAAFAEPREREARKAQAIYGGRWYADYREMLAREALDGVLVLSPDQLHPEHAMACLEAGLPVLVEKPIARSLVEAERMCRTAEDKGLALMTVATWRYAPPYRYAKRMADDGTVTAPTMFVGKFNLGYDYVDLFESGTIHLFDLTRWMMGEVESVYALGVRQYAMNRRRYPIDSATIALRFRSGAIGNLYTSAAALSFKPWARVEVYGKKAWLAVDDGQELWLYDSEEGPAKSWKPVFPSTLVFDEEFGGFMGIVENFAQVVRGNEPPGVTGRDGYAALELKAAAQISMLRGEAVTLPLEPDAADADVDRWLTQDGWPGE